MKMLLLSLFFFSFFDSVGQNTYFSERISIKATEQPLSGILDAITQQTRYRFSYNSQVINVDTLVSVDFQNEELGHVFVIIFPPDVRYKLVENYIILSRLQPEEPDLPQVHTDQVMIAPDLDDQTSENTKEPESKENKKDTISKDDIKSENFSDRLPDMIREDNEERVRNGGASHIGKDSVYTTFFSQDTVPHDTGDTSYRGLGSGSSISAKVIQVSFVYPLGTSWIRSPGIRYALSLNILGGYTGSIRGFELSTLFNINNYTSRGVQIAGGFNLSGVKGDREDAGNNFQVSTLFNYSFLGKSTQITVGLNIADTGCFQLAALSNSAKYSYAQISAGCNVSQTGKFQLGTVNVSKEGYCQLSVAAGITGKGKMQLSSLANVASESICQLSVLMNITGKGGFQLGLVNVRDTADGFSLGLISIVKKGGVLDVGIEGGELIHTAVTFRSGMKKFHTILSGGYNFGKHFWAAGAGFGVSYLWKNRVGLNLELLHYNLFGKVFTSSEGSSGYNALVQFRPVLHIRIVDHFKMFLGPTLNFLLQTSGSGEFALSAPYTIVGISENNFKMDAWVGIIGGVRF